MAHFYGTLKGGRGKSTRCGTKSSGMEAVAATWGGAVRVTIDHREDGKDIAIVELIKWKGAGVNAVLFRGPVDQLPVSTCCGKTLEPIPTRN